MTISMRRFRRSLLPLLTAQISLYLSPPVYCHEGLWIKLFAGGAGHFLVYAGGLFDHLDNGVQTFHSGSPSSSKAAPARETGPQSILFIEPDDDVRRLIGRVLRQMGHTVYEAENRHVVLGLWALHHEKINVLLVDQDLEPGFTGLDLARLLRTKQASLRVIVSSACGDLTEAITSSGFPMLPKPYNCAELREAINAATSHFVDTEPVPPVPARVA